MENTVIKEWFKEEFKGRPLEEDYKLMNDGVTFNDLFEALDNYNDIYELVGDIDSIIREIIFDKLAEIMGVDYNYIYDQWLRGNN